jgi:hypothetical protein
MIPVIGFGIMKGRSAMRDRRNPEGHRISPRKPFRDVLSPFEEIYVSGDLRIRRGDI